MRLAQNTSGKWVVYYNDAPIAISGQTQFDSREEAVEQIATRGLLVKDYGEIYRPVEPVQFQAAEPVEAEPETAPAPVASEDDAPAWAAGTEIIDVGIVQGSFAVDPEIEDDTPIGIALSDAGFSETVEVQFKDADPEFIAMMTGQPTKPDPVLEETIAAAEKIPAEPEEPKGKRGRPRTYTPEEAAERRRLQNRKYYHARKEARKAEVAERSKEWWETHPDKVTEYRTKANDKRRDRYKDDPEYRAKVAAYNRDYQARKRAERALARAQEQAAKHNEGYTEPKG